MTPVHERYRSADPVNAMSVDVEDYFHVAALQRGVAERDWDTFECRVVRNIEGILALFEERGVRATFFVLGWVAERYPALIRRIVAAGHEIASHGYRHQMVYRQQPAEFRADVLRTKALLEDLTGTAVKGYRAASYSIGRDNLWALDILQEAGHRYSSSVYPIRHDLYGMPEAPRFAFRTSERGILELPATTVNVAGWRLPCGGGGYFRLLPYQLFSWALRRVNRVDRQPAIFYFHPWEIDPGQPRIEGVGWKSRFRHYTNLERTEERLRRLLADFRWSRMDAVFGPL
jgi:polysaccharide deacetylase family protein (PEP-CTERM system associated)